MIKKHQFDTFVVLIDVCDDCKGEVTEVCGDCIDTVCEPYHAKLFKE
jgi:hypothetical protein